MRKTCWGSPLHAPWEAERLCRLHTLPSSPADQKYPHTYQQRGAGIADRSIFVFTELRDVLSVTQPGSAWEGPLEAAGAACCWQNQQRWPAGLSSQVLQRQPLPVLCCAGPTRLLLTSSLKPQAAADVPCLAVRPFLLSYLPFGHLQMAAETSPALTSIPRYGFRCPINLILGIIWIFRDLAQILLNTSTPWAAPWAVRDQDNICRAGGWLKPPRGCWLWEPSLVGSREQQSALRHSLDRVEQELKRGVRKHWAVEQGRQELATENVVETGPWLEPSSCRWIPPVFWGREVADFLQRQTGSHRTTWTDHQFCSL